MSLLLLPSRFNQQPRAAQIDRHNSLGARVIDYLPLNHDRRAVVSGSAVTYGANGFTQSGLKGTGLRGTGSGARASVPMALSGRFKVTLAFTLNWDAYADDDALAMEYGENYAVNNGILVDPNSSGTGGMFLVGVGSNGKNNLVAFPRPSARVEHRIMLAFDRTTGTAPSTKVWVDGARQPLSFPIALDAVAGSFSDSTLYLLSRQNNSLFGNAHMRDIVAIDGVTTDWDAASDAGNPFQILRAPARRLWGVALAAPTPTIALAWTEANDTAALSATATNRAALAWTEGPDTAAITAVATDAAALAWTEADDTQALSAVLIDRAALAWSEGDDIAALAATVTSTAALAWTEGADTSALQVVLRDLVALAWAEAGDVYRITATAETPVVQTIQAALAWAEGPDTAAVAIVLRDVATLAWTEQGDVSTLGARVTDRVALAWAEQGDIYALSGQVEGAETDILLENIALNRIVVFEGSRRVVTFAGNRRVVVFSGSKRIVRF